jgi:hypothetical protein
MFRCQVFFGLERNTNRNERTWDISCSFFEDPSILKNGNGRDVGGRSGLYIFSPNNKVINRGLRYFRQTRVYAALRSKKHRYYPVSVIFVDSEQRRLMSTSSSYFVFRQNEGFKENVDSGV